MQYLQRCHCYELKKLKMLGQMALQRPKCCRWVDKHRQEHFEWSFLLTAQLITRSVGVEGPRCLVDAGGKPRQKQKNAGMFVKVPQAVILPKCLWVVVECEELAIFLFVERVFGLMT